MDVGRISRKGKEPLRESWKAVLSQPIRPMVEHQFSPLRRTYDYHMATRR